ncbi:2446_t:CDS:2 [Entrophospora sp. SA101]|nr:2225_t:CDS:2 [Entrophospora sp. SA101]CAJ0753496.1 2446_t:CDS:2 [Entrophospora sp. SA101]CAJ0835539.1 20046_t:CDS:2 [Entrophospora sp. SA101]CAJ0904534.1 8921_t:CDS:2 [Entrophospora sp. SA101]
MSKLQNEEEIILTQLLDQKITGTPKEFYEKFTTFVNQKHHEALCNYLKMCGLNNKETKEYIKRHTNFAKTNSHNVIRKEDINSQNKSKYLMPETKSSKINSILSKYFEERLKELEENQLNVRPEISHNFILKIVNHCFSNTHDGKPQMELWVPSVIQYLFDNQMLANNIIEGGLIKGLMERNAWGLLEIALTKLNDISELELVNFLKYLISSSRTSEPSTMFKKTKLPKFLSLIISAPRNDYLMRNHLRTLDEEELTIILQILCHWIETYNKSTIFTKNTDDVENGRNESDKSLKLNKIPEIIHELDFFMAMESLLPCLESYHKEYLEYENRRKQIISNDEYNKAKASFNNDECISDYSVEVFTFL